MDEAKRKGLEARGWKVGTVAEFLEETPAQSAYIEMKLALATTLRETRQTLGLSQAEVAKRLKTRQPNIARMELGADRSVTVDLLVRALLELGVTPHAVATALGTAVGSKPERFQESGPKRTLRPRRVSPPARTLSAAR